MNREEYEAHARWLYTQPPKADQPGQKFPRGSRVKVADEMPPCMSHFEAGFEAIVDYTYAQKYCGDNVTDYALVMLGESGEPVNRIAWYHEDQLTLLSNDTDAGLAIIARYEKLRGS